MTRLQVLIVAHLLLLVGLVILLGLAPPPLPTGLVHWDAEWYDSIRTQGYFFRPDAKSSVAFFPLFPLLWRASHLGAIGISLLNLGLATASLYFLARSLRLRPVAVVLFMALPSCFFLYIPYTEACFFFFTSLVLVLLARWPERVSLLALVMFCAAFARVSAFFYLPALCVVEGVGWLRDYRSWPQRLRRLFICGLATGAGLVSVMVYQWQKTGVWFAFNKAEEQWDHHLRLPALPFISTTENDGALWIDGLAMLVGFAALLWLLRTAWRVVRNPTGPAPDRLLLFATTYIAVATLQVVFQAPVEGGHSSLMSLNRYVFCTPLFVIVLDRVLPHQTLGWRWVLLGFIMVLGVTASLGMMGPKQFHINWPTSHIPFLWGPVAGGAYAAAVLAYALLWLYSGTRTGRILVYMSSFALQLFFFYTYAVGHWVG
jgi:hypothetical protein